jgi:hypothetical protein
VHPGQSLVEKVAQVAVEEFPVDVVRLAAVGAVDGEALDAQGFEEGAEDLKIGQIRQDVLTLGHAQRRDLVIQVAERGGRVLRIIREGIERGVIVHKPTLLCGASRGCPVRHTYTSVREFDTFGAPAYARGHPAATRSADRPGDSPRARSAAKVSYCRVLVVSVVVVAPRPAGDGR